MTPERMAKLVSAWVRLYTRGLPPAIAQRRIEEIEADLHDQVAHERARGMSDRRIGLMLLWRMGRGVPADASWRSGSTIFIVLAVGALLLIPLVAMQFSDEVVWTLSDFAFAGTLLLGTALLFDAARKRVRGRAYRAAAGLALGTSLFLVWTIGAVGVIGEDGDPADLMYGAVLAAGLIGAAAARLRPEGMARAAFAMAIVQALVTVIALLAGKHEAAITSVYELVGVNAFFIALFVASGWLFRRAAPA